MSRAARRSSATPDTAALASARNRAGLHEALTLLALTLAVLWVYCPLELLNPAHVLYGGDFSSLHQRRLEFARDALFGPEPHLPAWYPRELLGTPFWSNLQNFPLIPTRLPLLLLDPWYVHAVGVNLAAVLSAAFTYLFCRQLAVSRLGSAVAGWTFACAGFFAARVLVGHFPLLEAYPALPLLLWLSERCAAAADTPRALRRNLAALAIAAGCVMVAGHPQVPVYAVGATLVYLAARLPLRRSAVAAGAVAAGVACMSFVLLPMLRLVGRSTRVLALDRAVNDVPFPAWRLKAFLFPWADGWPSMVPTAGQPLAFTRGTEPLFWETVCYVGWLPVVAAAGLLVRALVLRRRLPERRWLTLAVIGTAALVFALPGPRAILPGGPWTILRSPARQSYLTTFALALAAGVAVQLLVARFRAAPAKRLRVAGGLAVAAVLAGHAIDLRRHATQFLRVIPYPEVEPPAYAENTEGARVAIDFSLVHPLNRRIDDVGVFDSILLARPYRAMLAFAGWPPTKNVQFFDGSELGPRALAWAGAGHVATVREGLAGLRPVSRNGTLLGYEVPGPLPRAGFVPLTGARHLEDDAVYDALRAGAAPDPAVIFLPAAARPTDHSAEASPSSGPATGTPAASTRYTRVSHDEIEVEVDAPAAGYLRVLESWDPGWRATLDDRPAELLLADGFVMAVPLTPGSHVVRLTYSTPGAGAGLALAAAGVVCLIVLLACAPRLWFRAATPPP